MYYLTLFWFLYDADSDEVLDHLLQEIYLSYFSARENITYIS